MQRKIKSHYIIQMQVVILLLLVSHYIYQNNVKELVFANIAETANDSESEREKPQEKTEELEQKEELEAAAEKEKEKDFIKWVDFNVTYEALNKAYELDVASYESDYPLNWIELLSYLGAKYGGDFSNYKDSDLDELAGVLASGDTSLEELTKEMTYYDYYSEAYSAVLGGLVGEYEIEIPEDSENPDPQNKIWQQVYGLKAFTPIARGFEYQDYDDFGVSRSYGYKRRHLGHDMMGQVGTPVIAVESGYVEAMGWNQYGGWRLGIRSFDQKRYYYYAHLRKDFPYSLNLEEGSIVQAGDVIGYLGRTGYSATENENNIETPHLHIGLQLIFDESQKEGDSEIWVDFYQLSRFLYKNRSLTVKNEETKDWYRVYEIRDPDAELFASQYAKDGKVSINTQTEE